MLKPKTTKNSSHKPKKIWALPLHLKIPNKIIKLNLFKIKLKYKHRKQLK